MRSCENCRYHEVRENDYYCKRQKALVADLENVENCWNWEPYDADGHTVEGQTQVFNDVCILSVKGMTSTPQGGDSGHGGETQFEFINQASMDGHVYINGKEMPQVGTLTIKLYGDAEARVTQKALEWLAKHFKEQMRRNK